MLDIETLNREELEQGYFANRVAASIYAGTCAMTRVLDGVLARIMDSGAEVGISTSSQVVFVLSAGLAMDRTIAAAHSSRLIAAHDQAIQITEGVEEATDLIKNATGDLGDDLRNASIRIAAAEILRVQNDKKG